MEEKEKRGSGLLGYFTLALMTTAIVVSILLMVLSESNSPAVLMGTIPALLVISFMEQRVEVGMGEYLPKKLWNYVLQLVLWSGAALVLWIKHGAGGLNPVFVMLLAVIISALYLLLRVIHAMGGMKAVFPAPAPKEERKAEEKPAEPPAEDDAGSEKEA